MTPWLLPVTLIVSSLSLAAGAWLSGLTGLGAAVLAVGALWLIGLRRGWKWVAAPGLVLSMGAAAAVLLGAAPSAFGRALLIGGALLAFLAWDLTAFRASLALARAADRPALERNHFLRLGAVVGGGVILLALALSIEIELHFEWTALLALAAAGGLAYLAGRIRAR